MHAFLIIGSQDKRNTTIDSLVTEHGISSFDRIYVQSESGTSIGVSDIRRFITALSLSPSSQAGQAGIIANGELLTTEAQQALLKTLEEPPTGTLLYIGISNASLLLPTILSRCAILFVSPDQNPERDIEVASDIDQLLSGSPGSIVHSVSAIGKTREDLYAWIDRAIDTLRNDLLAEAKESRQSSLFAKKTVTLRKLLASKQYRKNNVSPYLLVDQALISATEKNEAV